MSYLQTSTANPYGHRPWQTSLYTTFGDFGWLKQPQNLVVREPAGIRPTIRKPPERPMLGALTLVSGSGRVLGRVNLGLDLTTAEGQRFAALYRMTGGSLPTPTPAPTPIVRSVYSDAVPVRSVPLRSVPISSAPIFSSVAPPQMPLTILPPPSVPPPPAPVVDPSGQVFLYTPGAPGQAGSPFPPPAPGAYPGSPSSVVTAAAPAAASPSFADQISVWLSGSMIAGIPNYWLAIGAGTIGLLLLRGGKKGRF
jgi:hypothetical protein